MWEWVGHQLERSKLSPMQTHAFLNYLYNRTRMCSLIAGDWELIGNRMVDTFETFTNLESLELVLELIMISLWFIWELVE